MIVSYLIITFMMLLYNTVRDVLTGMVDTRFNAVAAGATLMFLSFNGIGFWQILALSVGTGILCGLLSKNFALGDLEAVGWIMPGLYAWSMWKPIKFLLSLLLLITVRVGVKWVMKKEDKGKGYPLLLGSYIIALFW